MASRSLALVGLILLAVVALAPFTGNQASAVQTSIAAAK